MQLAVECVYHWLFEIDIETNRPLPSPFLLLVLFTQVEPVGPQVSRQVMEGKTVSTRGLVKVCHAPTCCTVDITDRYR